jgi:hypothetical protein
MNQLLRTFSAILLFTISLTAAYAQPGQGQRRQEHAEILASRRIAFISERMALTPEEAQVFWPLYNAYSERRDALMHEQQRGSRKPVAEMSEREAAQYAERTVASLEEIASLKREFHENLKKNFGIQKIALLYEAERDFNRMIFREARQQPRRGRNQ